MSAIKQLIALVIVGCLVMLATSPCHSLTINSERPLYENYDDDQPGLTRTRRAQNGIDDPLSAPIKPTRVDIEVEDLFAQNESPTTPADDKSQEMAIEESRLRHLIRQIQSNPYMPTQDQLIQLLSIALSLVLMAYLGPLAGPNAALVSSIVKQVIPILVTTAMSYATTGGDGSGGDISGAKPINAQIADVSLRPVSAPTSVVRTIA